MQLQQHHLVLSGTRAQREARLASALEAASSAKTNGEMSHASSCQEALPSQEQEQPLRDLIRQEVQAALAVVGSELRTRSE